MARVRRLVVPALVLVAGLIIWNRVQQKDLPTRLNEVDGFLAELHQQEKFNGVVLVAVDGEAVYQKGFGVRDGASGSEHSVDSILRIYSITKPFTSTLVFKLVEEGTLSLDDKLAKFFPEIAHASDINIEHLLTHTSGLYDFTREPEFENSAETLVELLRSKELDFPPGEGWQYCNSGYCLLGHIIAKVTGTTYEQAITDHILTPVGMKHSGFGFDELATSRPLDQANKSVGYRSCSGENLQPADPVTPRPFAAGAMYSTVGDLLLFHKAMLANAIIGEDSRNKAWSSCEQERGYGCGWEIGNRWVRRKVVSHSGGAHGFRSNFSQIPREGWCVIVLSNCETDDPRFVTDEIYDILDNR